MEKEDRKVLSRIVVLFFFFCLALTVTFTFCHASRSSEGRSNRTYIIREQPRVARATVIVSSQSIDQGSWYQSFLRATTEVLNDFITKFASKVPVKERGEMKEARTISTRGSVYERPVVVLPRPPAQPYRTFDSGERGLHTPLSLGQDVKKYGPWGNQETQNWNFQIAQGQFIKEIKIYHGFIVDAISFTLVDQYGRTTRTRNFGGVGGHASRLVLDAPREYITKISGKYGEYMYEKYTRHIASITIHTNLRPQGYGPYGQGTAAVNLSPFSTPPLTAGAIVGLHGNCGQYLDSIGVYAKPDFVKLGPWGGQQTVSWDFLIPEGGSIKEIWLRSGVVVKSITFKVDDGTGRTSIMKFGGNGGENADRIILDAPKEYITGISGTYADFNDQRYITKIYFYTNMQKVYGPYGHTGSYHIHGSSKVTSFYTPKRGKVVGFHGGARDFVDAIGVFIKRTTEERYVNWKPHSTPYKYRYSSRTSPSPPITEGRYVNWKPDSTPYKYRYSSRISPTSPFKY